MLQCETSSLIAIPQSSLSMQTGLGHVLEFVLFPWVANERHAQQQQIAILS
jgi:hypothetical protein